MGIIYKNSVAYGVGDDSVEITQADYDALSDAEKHNGKTYFITDADIPGGGDNSIELTLIEYKELERSGQIKRDVTYYVKDEESSITSVTLTTDKTKAIRFGVDEEGNWGYIPDGADTVIPFKKGEEKELVESIPILTSNTSSSKVTLSASSEYTGDYAAWKVADGDYGTLWGTSDARADAWIQFTYSKPTCIKKLYVVHREQSCVAKKFKLQVLDGSNWIDIGDFTNEMGDSEQTFTISNSNKYANYRILITENGGSGNGFRTIQLYEEKNEENSWVDLGYYGATDEATIDLNQFEDGILQYTCPFQTTSFFYVLIYVQNHHPIYMSRIIYDANRILYQWYSGDIGAILWSVVDGVLQIAASPDMVGNKYYRFTALPYSIPPI